MNKIREQLAKPFDGLRVKTLDELESVVKEKAILFSLFCAENYHTEFETWSRNHLPKGKFQDRKSYNMLDIEEIFKIFENALD